MVFENWLIGIEELVTLGHLPNPCEPEGPHL